MQKLNLTNVFVLGPRSGILATNRSDEGKMHQGSQFLIPYPGSGGAGAGAGVGIGPEI